MTAVSYFNHILTSDTRVEELRAFSGKVVGTLCNFAPEELILAAGAVPVRLCAGELEAEKAVEEFFPRDVCPVVKSSLGLARRAHGLWPRLDMVVIPSACDGKKKLADILSQSVSTHVMHLPASKTRAGGRQMWMRSVELFRDALETLTEKKITREALAAAIELSNQSVRAYRRFLDMRKRRPSVITGEDALVVTGASFTDDTARWTKETLALCERLRTAHNEKKFARPANAPRILLTGAPLIHPNFKIARLIESSGAVIAADELCSGTQRLYNPVVPRAWTMKEMLIAVADKRMLPCTCPCFVEGADRINRLLELAQEFAIDGVVYHNLRMCQLHDMESFGVKAALAKQDIPLLAVYSDYSQEDTPQIRTRVQAFLEMLSERPRTGAAVPK